MVDDDGLDEWFKNAMTVKVQYTLGAGENKIMRKRTGILAPVVGHHKILSKIRQKFTEWIKVSTLTYHRCRVALLVCQFL